MRPHAHFHDEQTGATHDIELPPMLLDQVNAILPAAYAAKSVDIIFRGSAGSPRPTPAGDPGKAPSAN